jgi:outer membrane protein assembly factor BamB
LILVAVLAGACGDRGPAEWPQFRGPGGVGLIADSPLPESWSADSANLRWRTEIPGAGNSSPVVGHGKIFLTTAVEENDTVSRSVVAVAADSGNVLWQTVIADEPREHRHALNTYAAPTPATDGELVYAFFGATLAAVDFDGEIVWRREVDPEYRELSHYGAASSAVLAGDVVVVARDREDAVHGEGWLGGFDRQSGEEVWRRTWVDTCCSYATPLVVDRPAGEEILFAHAARITSYDPSNGETLWSQELTQNQPVTSPTIAGDLLAVFTGADRVRNGAMLRLTGGGRDTEVEILWQTSRMIPQVSSPVLLDGLLYTVSDNGIMLCYEAETGKVHWKQRLDGNAFRPSLLAGDGKIYAVDSYARTSVVAAGPEFRLVAHNDLEDPGNASPAFGAGCLLLRTQQALYCIETES